MRAFASDNYAGAHPEVLAADRGGQPDHAVSYGDDPWTARAVELLQVQFGATAQPWLVFNGTARQRAVARRAHAHVGVRRHARDVAPARRRGRARRSAWPASSCSRCRRPTASSRPTQLGPLLARQGDEHAPQARVVSIANRPSWAPSTRSPRRARWPTSPTPTACCCTSTARGWPTRPSRSARRWPRSRPRPAPTSLSFGCTKNGALGVEAVVFFDEPAPATVSRGCASSTPSCLEDALHVRAGRRAARGRPVVALGGARQRDGRPAGRRGRGDPRRGAHARGRRPTRCSRG